jgi:hypothetical protein
MFSPTSPPRLYEPVGDAAFQARLNCGWHSNCADGVLDDGQSAVATDWQFPRHVRRDVHFRVRLFDSRSSSEVIAGLAEIREDDSICDGVRADVRNRYYQLVGRNWFLHTQNSPSSPFDITLSAKAAGISHSALVGSYEDSDYLCPSGVLHTHTYYTNVLGFDDVKNSAIPSEASCNEYEPNHYCSVSRLTSIWTRYHWAFKFSR